MKILLAVDGSTHALHAAKWVASHVKLFAPGVEVVLFHADAPLMKPVERKLGKLETARYYAGNAEYAFKGARKVLAGADVAFREVCVTGDPPEAIARAAKRERCAMIVMGSRGQGSFRAALLGSVTAKVIAQSPVPVLTVR
jgi:nucleotide-binding universal stress UspA family protein